MISKQDSLYQAHKRKKEEEKNSKTNADDQQPETSEPKTNNSSAATNSNNQPIIIESSSSDDEISSNKELKPVPFGFLANNTSSSDPIPTTSSKRKKRKTSSSPNSPNTIPHPTTLLHQIVKQEDEELILPIANLQQHNNKDDHLSKAPSSPSPPSSFNISESTMMVDEDYHALSPSLMNKMQGSLKIVDNYINNNTLTESIRSEPNSSDNQEVVGSILEDSKSSTNSDDISGRSDSSSKKSATTATNSSTTTVNESKCVRLNIHVHIPHQYIDGNTPIIKYQYKPVTTSIRNKKEELKTDNVELSNNGESDIWNGSILVPLNVDVITCKVVICNDERAVLQSEKELRSITLPKHTSPTSYHVYINFRPKLEKRQGIFDSLLKNKISMTEAFLMHIFTPSKINTDGLLSSDDVDNAFENLVIISKRRMLNFWAKLDGFLQSILHLSDPQSKSIHLKVNHTPTNRFQFKTDDVYKETKKFMVSLPQRIHEDKTDFEFNIMTTLVLFEKVYLMSANMDRQSLDEMVDLLKELDVYTINTIFNHVLKKDGEKVLGIAVRDSFRNSIQYLLTVFSSSYKEKKKFSFWILSSPFINFEVKFHGSTSLLETLILQSDKKRFEPEFATLISMVEEKRALIESRHSIVSETDLSVIFSTLFKMSCTLNDINCILTLTSDLKSKDGRFRSFGNSMADFMLKFDWQDGDFETFSFIIEKHPQILSKISLISNYFKNKSLLEVDHYHVEEILDHLVQFVENEDFKSNVQERELIAISKVLAEFFSKFFGTKKSTYHLFGKKSVYNLKDVIGFYSKMTESLTLTCLGDYQTIITESIANNVYFKSTSSDTYSKILSLIEICSENSISGDLTLGKTLAQLALDYVKSLGSGIKVLNNLLQLIEKYYSEQSEQSLDIVSSKIITYIAEMLTEGPYLTMEILLRGEPRWCRLFKLSNLVSNSRLKEATGIVDKFSSSIKNQTISLQMLRLVLRDDNQEKFMNLTNFAGVTVISKNTLVDIQKDVEYFEKILRQCHDFSNFMCQHDSVNNDLRLILEKVEADIQNNQPFYAINASLNNFAFLKELPTLQHLCKSELFLKMWNETIDQVVKMRQDGSTERVLLYMKDLKSNVYPTVVNQWLQLYNNLNLKTILFADLETLFNEKTQEECNQEMLFLKRTCQSQDNMLDGDATEFFLVNESNDSFIQWAREHSELIWNFLQVVKQKEYIPMVVSVLKRFNDNFLVPVLQDPYFNKISTIHNFILDRWESGNLFDVVDLVHEAKTALQHLGRSELFLIEFLNESDDLLQWLWQHSNTSQFNELIRVCREVTDDAIVLQSFASLTSCREYLYELIYPNQKFLNCESFLKSIRTSNQNKDEKEIQRRITDCKVIRANLENVKQVFKEKTRSPSVTAVLKLVEIVTGGTIAISTEDCFSGKEDYERMIFYQIRGKQVKQYLSDLIDIRTTVLNTTIPNELKEKHANLDLAIDGFCKIVNVLSSIKRTLIELGLGGSMIVDSYQYAVELNEYDMELNILQFLEEERRLIDLNSTWKATIKGIREDHRLLNYFNTREVRQIIKWLELIKEGYDIYQEKVYTMLKIINKDLTFENYLSFQQEWIDYDIMVDDDVQLITLGTCLFSHFNMMKEDFNHDIIEFLPKSDLTLSTMHVEKEKKKQNLIIIACQPDQEVEAVVYSLYAVQKRLPRVEEVLMCRSSTEFEDIQLLVRRWSQSRKPKQIFTIANIHHLDYTLQCKVVDMLKGFLQSMSNDDLNANLAIISGNQQQRIVNAFSNFRFDGSPLSSDDMRDSLCQIALPGTFSSGITVYTSKMAGCGKSHSIFEHAYKNFYQIAFISLRESVDVSELIQHLNEKTSKNSRVLLHFNIAPNVDPIVNSLLFELIVIGSIRDHKSNVYHRRAVDAIAIEIPNQVGNTTLLRLVPFCKYLPRIECAVSAKTLSLDKSYSIGTNEMVVETNYRKLKYVCSVLIANERQIFRGADFETFDPMGFEVSKEECMNVLTRHCNAGGQISFAIINNFVEFTYEFFENMMGYEMLRFLPAIDTGFASLPQSIIGMILEMSKDFAVRQLVFNYNNDNPSLEEYSNRFSNIRKWEDSSHPIIIFVKENQSGYLETSGFNVISLDQSSVNRFFPEQLRHLLHEQRIDINFDFKKMVEDRGQRAAELQGLKFLRMISGNFVFDNEMAQIMQYELENKLNATDYVLTQDNLMKMIAIICRFKSNLPVILHGESGGGKTYLISHLCNFLDYTMHRITLHGGNTESDIFNFLNEIIVLASIHPMATYVAFIDECNTCSAMAIVKEVVCDGILNGIKIPNNVKIVAALNPYRLKSEKAKQLEQSIQSQTGIIYKHPSLANIPDPLENLVYRVHPLPDSFIDHLYDFGSLSAPVERLYVKSMLIQSLKKYLKTDENGQFTTDMERIAVEFFENLIFASQVFIRETMFEESAVSLRDVRRCIQVFSWLAEEHHNPNSVFRDILKFNYNMGEKFFSVSNDNFINFVILSLSFAFYSRLNREERHQYVEYLSKHSVKIQPKHFGTLLAKYQLELTQQMNVGEGIALNEALTENIFILFLALVNHIPLLIQGYPGTCKSLAVDLVSKSMRGKASNNKNLQHLPDINIFAYQCSPLSEAKGIAQTFKSARQYAKESRGSSSLSVVLLDEIGLAADSPKLPLKILHQELENTQEISVVSISNYSLDSSKMNRMCVLYRSTPSAKDLKDTAKGIMRFQKSYQFQSFLEPIALSYLDLYKNQRIKQFFGLRDFYNLVKFLYRIINNKMFYHEALVSIEHALFLSILRNFGGIPSEDSLEMLRIFETKTGIKFSEMGKLSSCDLLKLNLLDSADARHLLVLTNNNSALNLLFDYEILTLSSTLVLFGSDFPDEKNDNFSLSLQLQKIKLAMSEGNTVVLVHCESLYESLYDLLNQHYVVVENKKFSRLAFGNSSVTCPVHDRFRIIIIAEASDAYSKLAIPFLNRMEKHVIKRDDMMSEDNRHLYSQLCSFIDKLMESLNERELSKVFIGYHRETLKSLVQSIEPKDTMVDEEITDQMDIAFDKLVWNMTPEAVIKSKDEKIMKHYFEKQEHSSLPGFMNNVFLNTQNWQDKSGGIQLVVTTFSSLLNEVESLIRDNVQVVRDDQVHLKFLELHDMKTSSDLNTELDHFFNSNHKESMLVLLCDPTAASTRRIHYAQYTCESKRNNFNELGTGQIKHVIFVVNLSRTPTESARYSFDFDRRWNYVFIDDISNSEQEAYPELFQLVNTPFSSLLTSTISVEQIILGNLHNSLSRVVYPFPRTGTQIQTQLSCLKKWLTAQDQNTSRFVKLIKERVLEIVRESVKNDEHWYLHVVNNEQNILQICGTLRSAIRYFISKVIFMGFSSVLSVLDRYNNLQLLNQSNFDTQCLWLDILELDVHNKLFESSMISMNQSGYVNILHGSSKHFDAKFPFSFIFTPVSNAFRVNNLSEEFSKEELEKHFEFSLPRFSKYYTGADDDCIIDDMVDDDNEKRIIPNILIDGYIDDYHILFGTKNCNILAEKDQLELIHEMLSKDLATMNSYSILDAQISYWNNEKRLRIYYQILDSLSDKNVSDKFLSNSKSCKTTIEMDMLLCELVIIYYNPETYITWWGERIHETSLWIRKVQNMSASMTQLLDLLEVPLMASKVEIDQSERSSALSHKWKCIKFFSHFLKDLANSSQDLFDADISKKYWEKLNTSETNHFLQQNALVDFLQTLTDINKKCSREDSSEDFECFICISVPEPENLRTTVCCKRYICYDCADEFCSYHKKSKSCGWCQKDLDNDESVDTYTIPCSNNLKEVEEISQKENSFIEKATKLIETFINKFCIERGVSESLIRDITSYICENKKFLSEHKLLKFILSDSMKSSIVRSLFSIKNIEPEQFEHVIANLEENLKALYNQSKNIDFPIAVCISQVLEDEVEFNSQDEEGNIAMEKMDSTMLKKISKHDFTLDLKNNFVDFLTNGSIAKVTIKYFVKLILKEVQFGPIFSELLTKSVNTLFTSSNNLVLYFLRILSSKVGLSETRDILNFNSVVNGMSFIKTWKNSEQVASFLKDSVLTSSNPFFNLPLYNEITRALAEIRMSNGDTDEQFKQMYATAQRQNSIHNLLGQLITVVLEEITLSNKVSPKNFDGLRLWCASNREMFSCYGISIFDLLISLITNKVPKFENINPETLMSEIQQLRCIVNLILMVFINPVCNGFFSKCLLAPQQIVNNLFPTMNDDILAGLGTITNGRVYQCPSGHVYVITECGRAATVSNCPECGQQIGGTNHNLLGTNKEYDVNGENSPTNLCYRVASEENGPADIYLTQRTLSAIEVRFIRLVMSGLLFASGSFFKTRSSSILNTRYANPRDVNTFFFEHFSNDWNIFSRLLSKNEEQTSAVVNSLLTRMRSTNIILQNSILTKTVRDTFERTVCENILGNVLKNDRILNEVNLIIQNHQNSIEHRKQNKNEKLAHSIELVNILPKDVPVLQPSLYMGLENITFEHFSNTFKQSHEEYPILETIITEIVSLQALKYLPHIFKMYIEVCKKCDKKLRKEQPLEQTIRQFIDEIQDPNERTNFSSYFEGFSKAWNLVFKYVEMYECLVIPQQMKNIKMSLDQQLAFILPHEKDESIFGIALTHYLVGIHNKFVKLVSKAHVTSEADIRIVSSSDLDTSLVFKFSSKRDLMPFVRDHCRRPLSYASTESIKYDFEFIQQHLSDHFFIGKPLVEIKIKMIEFIGELRASGAKERFSKLKKSNKHVADKFNDEEKETILIELGGVNGRSDRCVKVFRLVEMAIHFIQSSSVSVSALSNTILDKLLVEYLEKDLSVNEARQLFGSSLSKMIRIKHLDSLWELLESHLTVDSFAAVHTNYRKEISDKHKDLLKSIAPKIDLNILLTTLREAIQTHLTESFSDMNQDLKKWLYYLPIPDNFVQGTGEYANSELETISDFSWFNIIPDDTFTLGMVVEIFKTLEQIAKQ